MMARPVAKAAASKTVSRHNVAAAQWKDIPRTINKCNWKHEVHNIMGPGCPGRMCYESHLHQIQFMSDQAAESRCIMQVGLEHDLQLYHQWQDAVATTCLLLSSDDVCMQQTQSALISIHIEPQEVPTCNKRVTQSCR